jgi:hypothetical protein
VTPVTDAVSNEFLAEARLEPTHAPALRLRMCHRRSPRARYESKPLV